MESIMLAINSSMISHLNKLDQGIIHLSSALCKPNSKV